MSTESNRIVDSIGEVVSYDPDDRVVYFTGKNDPIKIFDGVSPEEFAEIEQIETYSHECMGTTDRLLHILGIGPIHGSKSKTELQSLMDDVIALYEAFPTYKSIAEDSEFERVRKYSGVIYKVKRPLENVFNCIGIVENIITNSQLIHRYHLDGHEPFHIQHLIINICAAVEHLGIVAVNRLVPDSGGIDPDDPQYNVLTVYEKIIEEGLHEPIGDDDDLFEEVSLERVEALKDMRDRIAHKSLIQNIPSREIPDGLRDQAYLFDESHAREYTATAMQLHLIAISVLISFVHDHVKASIEPYVEAIYDGMYQNDQDGLEQVEAE